MNEFKIHIRLLDNNKYERFENHDIKDDLQIVLCKITQQNDIIVAKNYQILLLKQIWILQFLVIE